MRSLGAVAVKLGERARMPADPWQADGLELICALREDGKWACFEYAEWCPRQNGKGGTLELRALAGFLVFGEALIVWSAHEYKTAMKAFARVKKLIKRLGRQVNPRNDNLYVIEGIGPEPILVKICNTNGEEGFERLDTNAQIQFVARSKGSARGFTADLQIIDEAFAYTMEQHAALLPTLSAVANPQIIYTSTPPLNGESGEVMYLLRHRGDPDDPREPGDEPWRQDDSLGYRDWGAGSDLARFEKDRVPIGDPALWRSTNPATQVGRITMETIDREFRSMGRLDFARERVGIWPALSRTGGALLNPALWKDMLDPGSRRHGDVVLMPDVTPMQDHASIGMFGMREDGLEHVQLVDYREAATWLVERMVQLHETLDPLCWVIDDKNGAAALLPDLAEHGITVAEDPEHPKRGNILLLDTADAAKSVGAFVNAYNAGLLRHIGQEPLTDAVRNVKPRTIGDQGQIGYGRRASHVDIGPINSVTGARYGYYAWKDLIDEPALTGFAWILGGSRG